MAKYIYFLIPATIFSNEPPPLDLVESDSDEDIFAELHRNRYTQNDRTQKVANVVDELFGNVESVKVCTILRSIRHRKARTFSDVTPRNL